MLKKIVAIICCTVLMITPLNVMGATQKSNVISKDLGGIAYTSQMVTDCYNVRGKYIGAFKITDVYRASNEYGVDCLFISMGYKDYQRQMLLIDVQFMDASGVVIKQAPLMLRPNDNGKIVKNWVSIPQNTAKISVIQDIGY